MGMVFIMLLDGNSKLNHLPVLYYVLFCCCFVFAVCSFPLFFSFTQTQLFKKTIFIVLFIIPTTSCTYKAINWIIYVFIILKRCYYWWQVWFVVLQFCSWFNLRFWVCFFPNMHGPPYPYIVAEHISSVITIHTSFSSIVGCISQCKQKSSVFFFWRQPVDGTHKQSVEKGIWFGATPVWWYNVHKCSGTQGEDRINYKNALKGTDLTDQTDLQWPRWRQRISCKQHSS